MIRKRNKYFRVKSKTNNPRNIKQHKSLKNEVQRRIRQVYWEYVNIIFLRKKMTGANNKNLVVVNRFGPSLKKNVLTK
jgi:hypothetical protein